MGLRLTDCVLDKALALLDASLPWLDLNQCTLEGITANGARIDVLTIKDCRLTGSWEDGALQFDGTHVATGLTLSGTHIVNLSGPALTAVGLKVGDGDVGGADMKGIKATGHAGPAGAVRLSGAKISGSLSLHGATLRSDNGPAFVADGLTVQDVMMSGDPGADSFDATGSGDDGTVRLLGATITGQFSLKGAKVESRTPAAGAPADGQLGTGQKGAGYVAAGNGLPSRTGGPLGAVCLSNTVISGNLVLRGAALTGGSGPALMAENLTVKGPCGLLRGPRRTLHRDRIM